MRQPNCNRSILVTGCSSGFGKLIARTMGQCGYRVYAGMRGVYDRNADAARELREWAARRQAVKRGRTLTAKYGMPWR